ncbi:MAG: thioredoxin domain-containing protein [Crocinitomicaceae bacterium]|nr:thioredoxin domain-containing protein [Crocinitomicaceae bacterium]
MFESPITYVNFTKELLNMLQFLKALFITILFLGVASCANSQKNEASVDSTDHKFTNELINETSPYLLQHAHNPVNWRPWGEEAFEKAQEEDKLVLISIGYSSCHWCHVMEHESFEDEEVADLMNENFICIKVDREERPDVDQVYMNAIQLMTGQGGWPLNCFTLPDGRPIYGGTYFAKDQWIEVLKNLDYTYEKTPNTVIDYAENLTEGVKQSELIVTTVEMESFDTEKIDSMVFVWNQGFDTSRGGNNRAPKFPLPNNWDFLMEYAHLNNDTATLEQVDLTLDKMAMGGIYDQVGGGFARYSTDMDWKVPHFEKMLYDNGQLVSLYAKAYARTGSPLYKHTVYQTLEWVYREMMTADGAFYSALDADSEGEEGKFYVWTKEEMKEVLGDDFDFANEYYELNLKGLWEGNYILLRNKSLTELTKKLDMSAEEIQAKAKEVNKKLLEARAKRIRPGLDDKSLASWNAIMSIGFADAYQAFGEAPMKNAAIYNGEWLRKNMLQEDGKLLHTYKKGEAKIDGFLDDYAFTISMFIKLYEITFDESYIEDAKKMAEYAIANFQDEASGMFYYTASTGETLIARKMEISDNVIPSSNSQMANALFVLGTLTDNADWIEISRQMLANVYNDMTSYPSSYSNWGILGMHFTEPFYEVALTGDQWESEYQGLANSYVPNKVLMGGKDGKLPLLEGKFLGETTIFVCVNKACQMPVNKAADALEQMK